MTDAGAPGVEAFWLAFCRERGVDSAARFDVFAFGDGPAMADELLGCVLHGPKRATAGLLIEHEAAGEPLPSAGAYAVVLDGAGRPRCVLRTTEVRVVPFAEVDADFARDEGEGDRSLAWWCQAHRAYFARACARLGREFGEGLAVVLERFELAWAPDPWPTCAYWPLYGRRRRGALSGPPPAGERGPGRGGIAEGVGPSMNTWIMGVVAALVSLVGLFVASRAHEGTFYYVGMGVAALGIAFIFALITRATGQPARTEPTDPHYP